MEAAVFLQSSSAAVGRLNSGLYAHAAATAAWTVAGLLTGLFTGLLASEENEVAVLGGGAKRS